MSLSVKLLDDQSKAIEVSPQVFNREFNEPLIHQVVVAYQAGARAGTVKQKTRSEVRGGGKKPWRQKGTGSARAGTSRSPLWRKGGKVFAAVPQDHSQKVNRKMYQGAMCSILSELLRQQRLVVINSLTVEEPKTKLLLQKLQALNINKGLIVTSELDENLYLAARNLRNIDVCDVFSLDPVSLVGYERIVLTVSAVKEVETRLL